MGPCNFSEAQKIKAQSAPMARLFALTCLLVGLLCVSASSSEFHSEHVAELGNDFQEKVSTNRARFCVCQQPFGRVDSTMTEHAAT